MEGTEGHEALVARAMAGDPEARDALFQRHFPLLQGYIRAKAGRLLAAKESSMDLAQSVCREVLGEFERLEYRGEAAFCNWLFTKALGKIADKQRYWLAQRRDARAEAQDGSGDQLANLPGNLPTASQVAIGRERLESLDRAFQRLSQEHRDVITCVRFLGLSHAEAAVALDRSEGAVRVLLHRALARLGRLMDSDGRGAS